MDRGPYHHGQNAVLLRFDHGRTRIRLAPRLDNAYLVGETTSDGQGHA